MTYMSAVAFVYISFMSLSKCRLMYGGVYYEAMILLEMAASISASLMEGVCTSFQADAFVPVLFAFVKFCRTSSLYLM